MTAAFNFRDASNTLRLLVNARARDESNNLRTIQRIRVRDVSGILQTVYDNVSAESTGGGGGGGGDISETASTSTITTADSATATVSGGSGSYSYQWMANYNYDNINPVAPNAPSTAFRRTSCVSGDTYSAEYFCRVTDAMAPGIYFDTTPFTVSITRT